MHPADIQAAIRKTGSNQAEIAARLGLTEAAVSLVIHSRSKSRRIADAIADITGLSLKKLWPGVYEDKAA